MHSASFASHHHKRSIAALGGLTICALVFATHARLGKAEPVAALSFASPAQAVSGLYAAISKDDDEALTWILGAGKEAVSSEYLEQDRIDREQFVRKYREMHRLAREPDGSVVLYVGAENWPFPLPLVRTMGEWHFDTEAGTDQVLLRRIAEDELAAIATCRALTAQDAPTLGRAFAPEGAQLTGTLDAKAAGDSREMRFHGYYFRVLRDAAASSFDPSAADGPLTVIAYPAEYRVTGVLTFVADPSGIYEADLGPPTVPFAKTLRGLDPTLSWRAIDSDSR